MRKLKNHPITHSQALVFLLIASIFWSMGGLLIKSIPWPPLAIAGARSAVAASVLWAFLGKPQFSWSRAQIGAALSYAATMILFVLSTKLTTAANAILLQYTAPIYVALFSYWFLGEKVTRTDWVVLGVVICGMVLFFIDDLTLDNVLGNVLALIAGVTFAWGTLFLRKQNGVSTTESILLSNIITFVLMLPWVISAPAIDAKASSILLVIGAFQLALPYMLYSIAIKKVTALEGILLPILEPLLNPVWVALFYGEKPSTASMVGGAIVIGAVTVQCLNRWAARTVESTM